MVNATVPFVWHARELRAAGLALAAYEAGSDAPDAPVVLLLHGLGHWSDGAWGRLVPRLDPGFRYVAFDLPGFGASAKPDAAYDRAFFARVIEGAVDALGLDHFALVGHSLGGFLAADYAGAHPERVARLALIAPAGFARNARHVVLGLASALARPLILRPPSRRLIARILRIGVVDRASLDPAHVERAYALAQDLALRRAFAAVYSHAPETYAPAQGRALREGFARYHGPVFCAWGRRDRYIGIAGLRGVTRTYPQARTLVLQRSAHLPMLEEPDTLATALRAFLAER